MTDRAQGIAAQARAAEAGLEPLACGHLQFSDSTPRIKEIGLGVAALELVSMGYAVFPLRRGGKKPHHMLDGLAPPGEGGFKLARADPGWVEWCWGQDPAANIGVPTGEVNYLLVVDPDRRKGIDGVKILTDYMAEHGYVLPDDAPWDHTPTNDGRHLWTYHHGPLASRSGRTELLPGVDVKADGGYVVAPPSMLLVTPMLRSEDPKSRKPAPVPVPYTWGPGCCPCQRPATPQWLIEAMATLPLTGRMTGLTGDGTWSGDLPPTEYLLAHGLQPHGRNDGMYALACRLWREHGMGGQAMVFDACRRVFSATDVAAGGEDGQPFTWDEALGCVESARKYIGGEMAKDAALAASTAGWTPGTVAPAAAESAAQDGSPDDSNAELAQAAASVAAAARPQVMTKGEGLLVLDAARWVLDQGPLRYGIDNQLWAYRNGVWVPGEDPAGDIVHERVAYLLGQTFRPAHETAIKDMIRAIVGHLRGDPLPDVINFRNGLLDWRDPAAEPKPHNPDALSTVQLAVNWNPKATCPQFDAFLAGVLAAEDIARMWEVIGYLLMSGNPLHKIFLMYGRGFNGKGVLLRTITAVLGECSVSSVSLHSLADERFTRIGLVGKLANICGDIDATYIERTGLLKQLTGEDLITAEHKFRKPTQFTNWAVPVFSANEMPTSSDTSYGWRERWEVFSFPNTFRDGGPDLERSLRQPSELEGIAAHAVLALRDLMSRTPRAFSRSAAGDAAKQQFIENQDPLAMWLGERAVQAAGSWTRRTGAYGEYDAWAKVSGIRHPLGKTKFYALMREQFPETMRDGYKGYQGLLMNSDRMTAGWAAWESK